jgi:hypothetical protein
MAPHSSTAAAEPGSKNSGSQAEALCAIAAALQRLADVIVGALNPAEHLGVIQLAATSVRDERSAASGEALQQYSIICSLGHRSTDSSFWQGRRLWIRRRHR